ncbi:MAG: type II 3-dehydroquinate dehydratase [Crocinitomicaceae bacterium]|nr:type II 3-dehydroquinate dehydratase [Crocinitomicaceae bacterium]|tara:strand:+ start:13950 stop:14372 length:423 start_codon:yes stop_codon:yes gene_type:complete
MNILIVNGPNLNLLGTREPKIYGSQTFEEYLHDLQKSFPEVNLIYYQSNVEGELINKLHECDGEVNGVIFNAGGYTHTSVAIADAVAAIKTPVIEVHISNVYARDEEIRHQSLMAKNCVGVITGFGLKGYELALRSILES